MSEPHEPSYYEIALTNRQVVVAFVILLVCLLSAFFSGVWIGRESTVRNQEQLARNAPPPAEPKKEGENLESLEFFDSREKTGKGHEARETKPETSPKPAKTVTPAPEPEPPPAESPVQVAAAAPPPAPVPTPPERKGKGHKGEPAATDPIRPAKPAEIVEPAVPKGAVVIQVFSSQDQTQAESIRKRLLKGGQKAFLSPVDVAGHTMYRVRLGPFTSRPDAQKVAEKVRKTYKLDTWVTE
ncbi:MAG TPA: SPOR domain-containing protein [Thermoanaerobaculia bacterium]|nr:SPOR domain-containing protein [Thermoanaerobaculia bacterium]